MSWVEKSKYSSNISILAQVFDFPCICRVHTLYSFNLLNFPLDYYCTLAIEVNACQWVFELATTRAFRATVAAHML